MADADTIEAEHARAPEPAGGWFVMRDGAQYGPITQATLREHLKSGILRPTDQLWSQSLPQWVPVSDVFQASAATPANRPPAPAAAREEAPAGATEPDPARKLSRRRKASAVVYALLIAVLMSLSLVSCFQFVEEGSAKGEVFALDGNRDNALTLTMQIVETDLVREHLRLYVTPKVSGTLSDQSPRMPARAIELTMASVGGPRVMNLKPGHHLEPFDIEIPLSDGEVLLYPMDRYTAYIEAEAIAAGSGEHVPVVIELNPRNHAMHVKAALGQQAAAGDVVLLLSLSRLVPIVAFTWFMSGVAAVLALTVVLVVVSVISGRRRPELAMLGWFTALLFALPAVRNNLPGAPPLGALIDYSAFFWAEALVGLSIMVLVGLWFMNREPSG